MFMISPNVVAYTIKELQDTPAVLLRCDHYWLWAFTGPDNPKTWRNAEGILWISQTYFWEMSSVSQTYRDNTHKCLHSGGKRLTSCFQGTPILSLRQNEIFNLLNKQSGKNTQLKRLTKSIEIVYWKKSQNSTGTGNIWWNRFFWFIKKKVNNLHKPVFKVPLLKLYGATMSNTPALHFSSYKWCRFLETNKKRSFCKAAGACVGRKQHLLNSKNSFEKKEEICLQFY